MKNDKYLRFKNDVVYDIAVSPFGYDYGKMTLKQVEDNFEWFVSIIPQRMDYLIMRCSNDMKISTNLLNFSAESLITIWKWFINTARMEKTPDEIMKKMVEGAKIFGDSFINREQFTISTQFIIKDIGMYIGQTFLSNYPQLKWTYYTKPKNDINARQPVLSGFYYHDNTTHGELFLNPLSLAKGAAQNFYSGTQSEKDVYDYYLQWEKWIQ